MKTFRNVAAIMLAVVALAGWGCATTETPAQKVFQIESNYKAGLVIAVAYKGLPECPTTLVCKKSAIVEDLKEADLIAFPGLQSAQACVRSPTCKNTDLAITAANTAVAALTAITSKLVVKEPQ